MWPRVADWFDERPGGWNFEEGFDICFVLVRPMSLEDRVKWLLSSVEHFDLLSKWCPEADVAEGPSAGK